MIEPVAVELTWREVHMAGTVAVSRTVIGMSSKKNRYGFECTGLGSEQDWLGALGEMAVAKWRNRFWNSEVVGAVDNGDVEVRAVGKGSHRLILHKDDHDGLPYVSALVERTRMPVVMLRGWIMGRDGKVQEYWADPTGTDRWAFFIERLLPMEELP